MKYNILHILKNILLLFSFGILIVAVYSSLFWVSNQEFPEGEKYINIVLDVSQSMNVRDIDNYSRLYEAKKQIYELLSKYQWYEFSLNIFAGESQRVLPFTSDIELIATFLQWIDSTNITKQGTRIDLALVDALESFGEDKTWVLIILTDGDEQEINIGWDIIQNLRDKQIDVYVLAIGTSTWWYIPSGNSFNPYKVYNWKRVIAQLNEKWLQKMSTSMGGKYITSSSEIDLQEGKERNKKHSNWWLIYVLSILWFAFVLVSTYEIYRK